MKREKKTTMKEKINKPTNQPINQPTNRFKNFIPSLSIPYMAGGDNVASACTQSAFPATGGYNNGTSELSGISHQVFIWDGSGSSYQKFYRNGVLDQDSTISTGTPLVINETTATFQIGRDKTLTSGFNGLVLFAALYDASLTSADVTLLYNAGIPNQPPLASAVSLSFAEGTVGNISLVGSDPEGMPIYFRLVNTSVPNLTLKTSSGAVITSSTNITDGIVLVYPSVGYFTTSNLTLYYYSAEEPGYQAGRDGGSPKDSLPSPITL